MSKQLELIKRSEPHCPMCDMQKTVLDAEGIEYTEVDIALMTEEEVSELNISSIPVLLIKDKDTGEELERLNGFTVPYAVKQSLTNSK